MWITRKVAGWHWLSVLFLMLLKAIPVPASEVVQAPVYQDGDWWVFSVKTENVLAHSSDALNDGEFEVRYENGKLIVFQLLDGGKKEEWPYESGDELRRMIGSGQDKFQYLRFPLSQSWEHTYSDQIRGLRRTITRFWTADHKGSWTKVATSLGVLSAFKIVRTETAVGPALGGRLEAVMTYSFSSETKSIVDYKFEGVAGNKREIKLVRFGVSGVPGAAAR